MIYFNKIITNLKRKEDNEKSRINNRKNRTINKADLNTQNIRLSKEENLNTQKNKRSKIQKSKNKFKKINGNPFLTEISFPNNEKRKNL